GDELNPGISSQLCKSIGGQSGSIALESVSVDVPDARAVPAGMVPRYLAWIASRIRQNHDVGLHGRLIGTAANSRRRGDYQGDQCGEQQMSGTLEVVHKLTNGHKTIAPP